MADDKDKSAEPPAPEELQPQTGHKEPAEDASQDAKESPTAKARARLRRTTYRPSHKATFIGLTVVVLILAVNYS